MAASGHDVEMPAETLERCPVCGSEVDPLAASTYVWAGGSCYHMGCHKKLFAANSAEFFPQERSARRQAFEEAAAEMMRRVRVMSRITMAVGRGKLPLVESAREAYANAAAWLRSKAREP
jgi:hypothetical protein